MIILSLFYLKLVVTTKKFNKKPNRQQMLKLSGHTPRDKQINKK